MNRRIQRRELFDQRKRRAIVQQRLAVAFWSVSTVVAFAIGYNLWRLL